MTLTYKPGPDILSCTGIPNFFLGHGFQKLDYELDTDTQTDQTEVLQLVINCSMTEGNGEERARPPIAELARGEKSRILNNPLSHSV